MLSATDSTGAALMGSGCPFTTRHISLSESSHGFAPFPDFFKKLNCSAHRTDTKRQCQR